MSKYILVLALLALCTSSFAVSFTVQDVTWTAVTYVSISGNSMTKNAGSVNTWDAGAFSNEYLAAGKNGYVETTALNTGSHRMIGFSDTNPNAYYGTIDFALYLHASGGFSVYENNSSVWGSGTYTAGDVFRVAREGTAIRYYKNGVVFYTSSTTALSGNLYADTSIYEMGGSVYNVKIGTEVTVPEPVSVVFLALGILGLGIRKIQK